MTNREQEKGNSVLAESARESLSAPCHRVSVSPCHLQRLSHRLDLLLAGSVLLLAFLVSSFIVRNSDFWIHLAGGRLLAQRQFHFGVDPFDYTTQQVYWVHPAWLFDLLLYELHGWIGGVGLVLVKALLITALAWLLLQVRHHDGSGWLPAVCTALAVLTLSLQLQLRSVCLSFFFLGLTFWLLWRPHADEEEGRTAAWNKTRHVCLLLLFALWVNLDSWFLLGPLLVGLFWMGERLQFLVPSMRAGNGSPRHTPTWLLPAALAVCLLSPQHWHAFFLPAEPSLSPADGLWHDTRYQGPFASPWQLGLSPLREINLAAWACVVLTGLGVLSFALNWRGVRGWHLLVWGGFGLLGAWQTGAIPFFAVVAAPITVLNLQDYLSRRSTAVGWVEERDPPAGRGGSTGAAGRSVLCRFVLLVANVLLLLLAWPGWLRGFHHDERRVGWGEQPDPSLQRVAETIQSWRQRGRLGDGGRGLAFHSDVARYCAWFCPEEQCVFDPRFSHDLLFDPERWQQVFRNHVISYLILDDPDTFTRLVHDPHHWILLHVDGRAAIFGWRDEEGRSHPVGATPLDINRLAFTTAKEDEEPRLSPAPGQGPGRDPQVRDLWARFRKATPPPAIESDTAAMYLRYFRAGVLPQHQQRWTGCWATYAAGLTGLALSPAASPSAGAFALLLRLHHPPPFLGDIDRDLPAGPLLAVRLARRALATNPDDAAAYLRLGQAYLALHHLTGERSPNNNLALLAEMRHIQIATALQHALILDPELETAHQLLANLYTELGYLDAALDHRREERRLARRTGPLHHEEASAFDQRLRRLDQQVADLERVVQNGQRSWALASKTGTATDPLADAETALHLGLARMALDEVLLPAPAVLLGSRGVQLESRLELHFGHVEQLRSRLLAPENQEHKRNLGYLEIRAPQFPGYAPAYRLPAYDWLILMMAAASGDYDLADAQLREVLGQVEGQHHRSLQIVRHRLPLSLASEMGLYASPQPPLCRILRRNEREESVQFLLLTSFLESEWADLNVLGGMLALERGLPQAAENYLTEALYQPRLGDGVGGAFASRAFAETYLHRIQQAARR